ncbi:MAG: HYExAFE family protein [Planctomycetales bacterium]
MIRANHYDGAFEDYLRRVRIPHVSVDEARRALLGDASLKSMDFIVSPPGADQNLLVDIKGRKFPSGGATRGETGGQTSGKTGGTCWENWVTEDDITSLLKWQEVFGPGFRSLLVFAYDVLHPRYHARFPELHAWRGRHYAYFGVWVDEYAVEMRERSASWQTRTLPRKIFRELSAPIRQFLNPGNPATVHTAGTRAAPTNLFSESLQANESIPF